MKILEYQESFGSIRWQEDFIKELVGRSIEEQLRCFAFVEHHSLTAISYQEIEKEIRKKSFYLDGITPIPARWSVIVKEGMIVGVAYDEYVYDETSKQWKIVGCKTILPYQGYIYDSTSDNNGSGYKTRDWYKYLVCLPYNHTLW